MADENARGFHNPASEGHDHNRGGSVGGEGRGQGARKEMREPTNHAGHTYDKSKTAEHDRRTEATRVAHGQHGHRDGLSKHGESFHQRGHDGE